MLRDNLVGLIEPMLSSAGANPLALCTARKRAHRADAQQRGSQSSRAVHCKEKPSDDRPSCLENPRPEGAESYTNGERRFSISR